MAAPVVDLRRPGWKMPAPPPRQLVFRHGRRQLRKSTTATRSDTPPPIAPGQEQLFSSYVPGLEAGQYSIDVTQTITAPNNPTLSPTSSHLFNVIAPRFALPENAIDSFYPPQGHSDRPEVLPHVVFNDPTLPWERVASSITSGPDYAKNKVPWLVVLLFTQDELRLSSQALSTIFQNTSLGTNVTQSETLSVNMKVAEIPEIQDTASSVKYDATTDGADTTADLILLQSALFNALFTKYDNNGVPDPSQTNGWVQPCRFLAHVRHIHLDGTATAAATDDDDHAYSVVLGPRTGPLDIAQPTTVIAHVVNIEGVESMSFPVPVAQQQFVAMTSLHSWAYTCLPPNSLDVEAAFVQLGSSLGPLRPVLTDGDKAALQNGGKVGTRVSGRLNDGFSMLRYRLQTGEVSAAFFRGPFTPTTVAFPAETPPWPASSTTGTQLQILDDQLNIMDLTYSAAWTLGKTLALADQTFTSALARVRQQIFDEAMNAAQVAAIQTQASELGQPSPYRTREDVVGSIAATVQRVGALPASRLLERNPQGLLNRWHHPAPPRLDFAYKGGEIGPTIDQSLGQAAALIASTTDDGGSLLIPPTPYNEFNTPYSPDWAVVLKWVMDRYFLARVPPHYFVSDPSHLPQESLRLFYIDNAWVSAMIDGGLSLANHLDHDDDRLRDAIKGAINTYLTTPILQVGGYVPPVPTYGFLLRSALVTKFPDMIVDVAGSNSRTSSNSKETTTTTTTTSTTTSPPVLLRHEVIGPDTMLGMLLEPPTKPGFTSLFLREPPHQQYFTAGTEITPTAASMEYKRVYTTSDAQDPQQHQTIPYAYTRGSSTSPDGVNFIWGTTDTADDVRLLNVENYAADVQTQLLKAYQGNPTWYTEPYPTAALMGFQLNEPSWQLEVDLPGGQAPPPPPQPRTLPLRPKSGRIHQPRRNPSLPAPPPIACAPHPEFGHRPRAPAPRPPPPAPHVRLPRPPRLSVIHPTGATTATPRGEQQQRQAQLGDAPGWTFGVYSLTSPTGTAKQLYTLASQQDLIFTAHLDPKTAQDFQLESLAFSLPLTAQDQDLPMMHNYDGDGATMLSNLRLNALHGFSEKRDAFIVTLVPRAGLVRTTQITDASFMLSGVVLTPITQKQAVAVQVTLTYQFQQPWSGPMYVVLLPSPQASTSS